MLPYQVNTALLKLNQNPDVKFLHCLSALHDTDILIGAELASTFRVDAESVDRRVWAYPWLESDCRGTSSKEASGWLAEGGRSRQQGVVRTRGRGGI